MSSKINTPFALAVLASGNGSNFQAILDAIRAGSLRAQVAQLICDKPQAKVLERARAAGVPVRLLEGRAFADRQAYDAALRAALAETPVDLVVLAGFMRILGPQVLAAYPGKIVNIHPALLPDFPGLDAIARALAAGCKSTGVTVHFVDAGVDTGPIIAQESLDILEGESVESLEKRVHLVEHSLYPRVIQWFVEGRVEIQDKRVLVQK